MKIPIHQSTRARLFLLVLLVAVPAFLVQVFGAWSDLQQDISTRKQDAGQIVVRAQGKFETLLKTSRTVITEMVRLNEMRTPGNCTLIFNDLHLAYERLAPDATNIGLSDAGGNIYCAINPIQGNKNIANQAYFLRATQTLDMAVGVYNPNPSTGTPTLSVAYPVLSFDGKVQTVIFITYELRWLENWQREVALPAGTALTLISGDGDILQRYLNGSPNPTRGNAVQAQWYTLIQTGQAGLEAPDLDGVIRLHTLAPLRQGSQTAAWLHLGYPVAEIYTQAEQALSWKLTLLGIVFVFALGLAWWGSETLFLHPLNDLMQNVEKVQQGDLTVRAASAPAVGELTGLAQAFDRMAESLQLREIARQDAQAELQQSEARFRAAFQCSAIGMGLLSLDGRILQVNDAVCKTSGYSREELLQRYDQQNVFPEDAEIGLDLYSELQEGARDYFQVDKRFVRKSGEVFWARQTLSLVRNADGSPAYFVGMIEDIDQQKRAAEGLRESEARFRAMYDNAAVGMAMMSLGRRIVSVNQSSARMTGYPVEELIGMDPSLISFPEDREIGMDQFREMVAGKIPGFQMEKRFVRKKGEIFWARVTYSIVPDRDGQPEYIVGMIEEITDQKLANEKLAEQEAEYRRMLEQRVEERTHELAEANLRLLEEIEQRERAEHALATKAAEDAVTAERTRLARDLHDAVTQTLFAASLIAEVLPDLWAVDVEEARNSTEELRQLTRGALAEMRTLLLELRPAALTQTRLGDLIRQLCEALIGRSRLPINLVLEGDRTLPPEVQVAFYRIAQESLNNVFKYARATRVNVSLYLTPAGVHLDICDNGVGFDMSTQKPTSLGMRIMRERAEAVGADLSITSEPGSGVCVDLDWVEKPDMQLSVFKKEKGNHYDN